MSLLTSRSKRPEPETPLMALSRAKLRAAAEPLAPALAARRLGPYSGYLGMLERIEHLVTSSGYRLLDIGRSVQGEPIFALHAGPEPRGSLLRSSVILSGVHPIEWIGVETHLALLDRIAGKLAADRSIVSIPIVNPDGVRRVDGNLRAGKRQFVRHNARGVDLNRNFDHSWGKLGWVQRALGRVFRAGVGPASEPEVESVAHHLGDCRVDRALSLHSFGGAVLYPRASSRRPIPDAREHRIWARRIARAIDPAHPYVASSCANWAWGLTAGGLELDWFHARHGALSLLVECSRKNRRLGQALDPFAWFNPESLATETNALARALEPYVLGLPS
ncbi:MAG: M14 family metallopeptidase [Polyangiaceae bacterium]